VAAGGVRQDVMSSLSLAILLRACELYSLAIVFVPCTLCLSLPCKLCDCVHIHPATQSSSSHSKPLLFANRSSPT
jgi:hypothetical protein